MDYNHVAVFVQVVKTGGFSAAARVLGLPKSAVSRTIALLEQNLKVRLLQRTTRKVTPTEAGATFYEAVKGPLSAMDAADGLVREHGATPHGLVRMTVAPEFGELPLMLTEFNQKFPAVQIELSVSSRFVDLIAEGFDLAIRAGKLEDSSLVARRVGSADLAVMAAPSYLQRHGRPKTFEDLADHNWVTYRALGPDSPRRGVINLLGPDGPRAFEAPTSLSTDDLSFCRKAVVAGAGLGLLPIHNVLDALKQGQLEHVLPGWSTHGASIYVVVPSSRYVPTRVSLLREFLVERLSRQLHENEQL